MSLCEDMDYESALDLGIEHAEDKMIDELIDAGEWVNWNGNAS